MDKNIAISILPSPANAIVTEFFNRLLSCFGKSIEGIYCTGSIPLQDFYPDKSDIDLVVSLDKIPDPDLKKQLLQIHKSIQRKYSKPALSVIYLARETSGGKWESISWRDGNFLDEIHTVNPLFLFELHTTGLTLYGIPVKDLNLQVTTYEVDQYLLQNINSYWASWVVDAPVGKQMKLLFFPRLTEWVVLGMIRQLYTLETGKITSKSQAGYYGLSRLPCDFEKIINVALLARKSNKSLPVIRSYIPLMSFARIQQTRKCGQYILDQFNNRYREKYHAPGGIKLHK